MSSSSRSIVALEVQAVDILHIKSYVKTKDNPKALIRILNAFRAFRQAEADLYIDPNMSNKKRKIILARQHEIIELLDLEIERIRFCLEDSARCIYNYHKSRYLIHQQFLSYMQPIEEGLSTQKNKLLLRMEGFTKQILDNIFDDSKPFDIKHNSTYMELTKANNNINNTIIYKLQYAGRELVSKNYLPEISYFKELFQFHSNDEMIAQSIHDTTGRLQNNYNPLKVPIVLLNALQYLDILSSHNLTLFKQNQTMFTQFKTLIHTFITIIPEAFLIIKQWRHATHLEFIGMFLFQTVQTLRSVLDMMLLLHVDMLGNTVTSVQPTPVRNRSSSINERVDESSDNEDREETEVESLPDPIVIEEFEHAEFWDNCFTSPMEKGGANLDTLQDEHCYSMHHLATDLILMLKVVRQARIHNGSNGDSRLIFTSHGTLSNYGVSSHSHSTNNTNNNGLETKNNDILIVNTNTDSSDIDDHVNNSFNQFLKMVASYTTLGSSLVTNMLHCSDMVLNILIKTDKLYKSHAQQSHIPVLMDTLPHELLVSALQVGHVCLGQYAVRLGAFNNLHAYSINDTAYVTACDNEAIAIVTIATLSFANLIPDSLAVDIFKMAFDLCISRCSCFLLVSAYFKCNLAACLYVINSSTNPEVTDHEIQVLKEVHYQAKVNSAQQESAIRQRKKKSFLMLSKSSSATNMNKLTKTGSQSGKKISFISPSPHANAPLTKNDSQKFVKPIRLDMSFSLAKRSDLIVIIGDSLLRVMGLMYLYKTTLSISHCGMIIVRLITRDLFIKKTKVDEFLTVMLSKQLQPLQEFIVLKKDTDDDDHPKMEEGNNNLFHGGDESGQSSRAQSAGAPNNPDNVGTLDLTDMSSVSRASTPQDTERRSLNSGGGGMSSRSTNSRGGTATAAEYVQAWKMNNMLNLANNTGTIIMPSRGGKNSAPTVQHTAECSFVELLYYIGENHLQSVEVVEQLLLLVEHIASKSQLNKYLLIESGMLPIVLRIKDTTQWDNNYILALSEICIDLIDI